MRRAVRTVASFHCAPLILRTRPDRIAATNTPVPAADSQLMVKRAASGLAPGSTTGGVRCTRLCSAGMSHAGSESVPVNGEPSNVVLKVTAENKAFRYFFHSGMPHTAQQMIRIAQGIHAYTVSPTLYLYFHVVLSVVAVAVDCPAFAIASRSDFNRKRVLGCHTKRR